MTKVDWIHNTFIRWFNRWCDLVRIYTRSDVSDVGRGEIRPLVSTTEMANRFLTPTVIQSWERITVPFRSQWDAGQTFGPPGHCLIGCLIGRHVLDSCCDVGVFEKFRFPYPHEKSIRSLRFRYAYSSDTSGRKANPQRKVYVFKSIRNVWKLGFGVVCLLGFRACVSRRFSLLVWEETTGQLLSHEEEFAWEFSADFDKVNYSRRHRHGLGPSHLNWISSSTELSLPTLAFLCLNTVK